MTVSSERKMITKKSGGKRKNWIPYAFTLPYFTLFLIFTVLPVAVSIVLSFTDFNLLQIPKLIGGDNYSRLFFEDRIFIKSIGNTIFLAAITGPLGYLLSLLFAWFINELRPGMRAFVTLIFYAPAIAGNAFLIWQLLFSGDSYGYINAWLMYSGIIKAPLVWLKDARFMIWIVALVSLWTSLGTSFLSFIAGFQGVDKSYYEAAAVDGITNRWQELWFITLPTMRPQLLFGAVMSITASFNIGATVTAMLGFPSNNYAAHTIINHLEDYGGMRYELGYACTIATVLFAIQLISNFVIRKLILKVGK